MTEAAAAAAAAAAASEQQEAQQEVVRVRSLLYSLEVSARVSEEEHRRVAETYQATTSYLLSTILVYEP
jgi:hypothetical protein